MRIKTDLLIKIIIGILFTVLVILVIEIGYFYYKRISKKEKIIKFDEDTQRTSVEQVQDFLPTNLLKSAFVQPCDVSSLDSDCGLNFIGIVKDVNNNNIIIEKETKEIFLDINSDIDGIFLIPEDCDLLTLCGVDFTKKAAWAKLSQMQIGDEIRADTVGFNKTEMKFIPKFIYFKK